MSVESVEHGNRTPKLLLFLVSLNFFPPLDSVQPDSSSSSYATQNSVAHPCVHTTATGGHSRPATGLQGGTPLPGCYAVY